MMNLMEENLSNLAHDSLNIEVVSVVEVEL